MTDFYIFRHGNTVSTEVGGILSKLNIRIGGGSANLPILPKGVPALEKIGGYLKNIPTEANFTSPFARCIESSNIVGKITGRKYVPDERIREYDTGRKDFSAFRGRIIEFLDEINKKNYSSVSICTHGAVIAAIKHLKLRQKFHYIQVLDFPNPGNLIIIKGGRIETLNFNK